MPEQPDSESLDAAISNWSESGVDEDNLKPSTVESAVAQAVTESAAVVDGNTIGSAYDNNDVYVSFS